MLDGSNDADSHLSVPFFGFHWYCSPFWRSNSQKKTNLGAWIGVLAKCAKNWNVRIIKTSASIITKFCTVIEITEYSPWVVQLCSKKIQDGGWPPSWEKNEKSQYLCNTYNNFEEIWQNGASWIYRPSQVIKIHQSKKSKMEAAVLRNQKIAISPRWMDQFQQNLAWWRALNLQTPSSNKILPF